MTVVEPDRDARADHSEARLSAGDSGLLSMRALLIITLSGVVALLAGLAAGTQAGLGALAGAGPGWGLAVGIITGLAAAALAGLTCAGGLHVLIGRTR